jgi:hypothetical protein
MTKRGKRTVVGLLLLIAAVPLMVFVHQSGAPK